MTEVAEVSQPKIEKAKEAPILVTPERMDRRKMYEYKKGLNDRATERTNAIIAARQAEIDRIAKDPDAAEGDVSVAGDELADLDGEARGVIETASADADAVLGEQSLPSGSYIGDPEKGTALNVIDSPQGDIKDAKLGEQSLPSGSYVGDPKKGTALRVNESKAGEVSDSGEVVSDNQQESVQSAEKKSKVTLAEEFIAQKEASRWIEASNITDPDKMAAAMDRFRKIYVGNGLNYGKYEANARAEAAKIREKGPLSDEDAKEVVALAEEAEHWHAYANAIKVALAGDKDAEGLNLATDEVSVEVPAAEGETMEEVVEGGDEETDSIEESLDETATTTAEAPAFVGTSTAKPLAETSPVTSPPKPLAETQTRVVDVAPSEAVATPKTAETTQNREGEVNLEHRLFELWQEVKDGKVGNERGEEIVKEVTESLEGNKDYYRLMDGAHIVIMTKNFDLAKRFLGTAEENNHPAGQITSRLSAERSCTISGMFAEAGDFDSAQASLDKAVDTFPKLDGNQLYDRAVKALSKQRKPLSRIFGRK